MDIDKIERLVAAHEKFVRSYREFVPKPGENRYPPVTQQDMAAEAIASAINKEINNV